VSAERYAPAEASFAEPDPGIRPQPEVPRHFLRGIRTKASDLADPEAVARRLLEDWLVGFRNRDVFRDLESS
jgi:hypothetical protein